MSYVLNYSKDGRSFSVAMPATTPHEAAMDAERYLADGATSVEITLVAERWPEPTSEPHHYIEPSA